MNLSNLLMDINKGYSLDDLIKLNKSNFEDFYPHTTKDFDSYDDLNDYLASKGMNADKIYFNTAMFNNCWYIDGDLILVIPHLAKFHFKMVSNAKVLDDMKNLLERAKDNNEWEDYISMQPSEFQVDIFKRNINRIPKDMLISVFKEVYTSNSQVMESLGKEYIVNLLSINKGKDVDKLLKYCDKDGNITVYRGTTPKSTPIEEALSFTLDINVAKHFAICVSKEGNKIYQCKVKPQDVLLFVSENGEAELLIDYKDLVDVECINILDIAYLYSDEIRGTFDEVSDYLNFCKHLNGIHGYNHSYRMLQLACCMYNELKDDELNYSDFKVLALACALHDIGRKHDGVDKSHGENAVKLLKGDFNSLRVENGLSDIDIKTLELLIKYHCYDDGEAIVNIAMDISIPKQCVSKVMLMLSLFKDLDGLDRVRTKDFDMKYLRTKVAYSLVGIARHLYKAM